MTRFARAKGSKASNEKLPEQPTSWSEMRKDLMNKNRELVERQQREQALNQRQKNYKAFLQEKEEEETKNTSWADFSDANKFGKQTNTSMKKTSDSHNYGFTPNIKKVNTNVGRMDDDSDNSDEKFMALKTQIDKALAESHGHDSDSDAPPEEISIKQKPDEIIIKKTKKPKQKLKIVLDKEEQVTNELRIRGDDAEELTEREKRLIQKRIDRSKKQIEKKKKKKVALKQNTENTQLDELKRQKKLERRKRQKEKKAQANGAIINNEQEDEKLQSNVKIEENLSEADLKNIQKKKERRARQAEKRKKLREIKAGDIQKNGLSSENGKISVDNQQRNISKPIQKLLNNQQARKAKPRDNEQHQSRKQKPEKMIINGKTVEVDYVDGFPVKKEDADRLKKLRKEMISKGLPRSEINIALKLERRRAEKAFAREKKNVCFNCRKSGHNLSECPELDKDQMAQSTGTGICFKCGSTEHTHFECKVVRGLDYKFATCFICKEQGHIAKQCPDNQRGLYPKGGSCKVCGDVTHLKKDCPKYQAQQVQLQNSLSIGTMDNGNPDDLSSNSNNLHLGGAKRLNKVIKF